MLTIYKGEDFKEITKNKVLVDFYASWCGPCKMLGPVLEKLSSEFDIVKIDVDEYPDLAREYGVMSIPTLILFDEGQETKKTIGFLPEEDLREFVTK